MNDKARVKRHRKNVATGGLWETYSFRLVNGCQEPIASKLPEDLNRGVISDTIYSSWQQNSIQCRLMGFNKTPFVTGNHYSLTHNCVREFKWIITNAKRFPFSLIVITRSNKMERNYPHRQMPLNCIESKLYLSPDIWSGERAETCNFG